MLDHNLDKIKSKLTALNNQNRLLTQLQNHTSFVTQSEDLDDYFAETQRIAEQLVPPNKLSIEQKEHLQEKLTAQLSVFIKLAENVPSTYEHNQTEYKATLNKQHQQLAKYRQYLQQFDDKIRTLADAGYQDSIQMQNLQKRRQNCLQAINNLEDTITRREKFGFRSVTPFDQ
ncbi:primosomal replication protein [Catenovulum sp. SM1970]|uniref:primosomal replication protein PriC n=1 Tax=Marinifaba aquimaris TaxID=2741323 RepID=UPI0015733B79|nr:primosomal replication protein PriC [Marinifaba aquimaris]NTS78797.1 primosomal replication protein [Marinifaba aquimaris]